jgi:hypothetical protein
VRRPLASCLFASLGRLRSRLRSVAYSSLHLEIATQSLVAAPPAEVWKVLTEFASYPSWNPFITVVSGEASPGRQLRAVALPARGPGLSFRALVTAVRPGVELRWTGVLFFRWLFHGHHYFVLDELPSGPNSRPHGETPDPPRGGAPAPPDEERGPPAGADAAGTFTLLRHGEVLGGILTPVIGRLMAWWMRPGFERMNRALKMRAESAARATPAAEQGDHPD